jgi:hypothetical protein
MVMALNLLNVWDAFKMANKHNWHEACKLFFCATQGPVWPPHAWGSQVVGAPWSHPLPLPGSSAGFSGCDIPSVSTQPLVVEPQGLGREAHLRKRVLR